MCAGFLQLPWVGLHFAGAHGLLTAVGSFVVEHRL